MTFQKIDYHKTFLIINLLLIRYKLIRPSLPTCAQTHLTKGPDTRCNIASNIACNCVRWGGHTLQFSHCTQYIARNVASCVQSLTVIFFFSKLL